MGSTSPGRAELAPTARRRGAAEFRVTSRCSIWGVTAPPLWGTTSRAGFPALALDWFNLLSSLRGRTVAPGAPPDSPSRRTRRGSAPAPSGRCYAVPPPTRSADSVGASVALGRGAFYQWRNLEAPYAGTGAEQLAAVARFRRDRSGGSGTMARRAWRTQVFHAELVETMRRYHVPELVCDARRIPARPCGVDTPPEEGGVQEGGWGMVQCGDCRPAADGACSPSWQVGDPRGPWQVLRPSQARAPGSPATCARSSWPYM